MRSTFKVLFYLKCNAPKKDGLIPVMCRITINGKIAQFSCKLDVEEKSWNVELGRVSGRSIAAQETNRMLDKIRVGINQAYQKIADRDNYVTAEKVRNAYLGLGMNHETLLAVFRQHNEDYGKQVGKLKSPRSYWKYCTMYKHLSEFVEKRYKVSDIAFKELTPAFITDFELFLRVEKNHCNNTVWSYMMPFRKIIYMAVNNGLLQRDPVLRVQHHEGGDQTGFSDPRGNHTPDQRHIQKEKLRADPRSVHLLHLYGFELDGYGEPDESQPAHLVRRASVDRHELPENRRRNEYPVVGRCQTHHREIRRHGRKGQTAASSLLRQLQERHQSNSEEVRYRKERHVASKQAY